MTLSTGAPTRTETVVLASDGARLAVSVLDPLASPATRDSYGGGTVVLAHGWAASRRLWGTVADRLLRAGHRVVLYDQRGHGASGQGQEPIGIERFGKDLAVVLNGVDASDAIVVGHSGGGFAAMAYATADPQATAGRLGGLVLLATAAHDQDTSDGEVRMMGSGFFSWALARPDLGRRLLRQTMGKQPDLQAIDVNRQMFAATSPRVRADCFRASRGMDLREGLASVRLPAVVLAGSADRVIAPALGRAVAEALPRARFEELPGMGHMLPLEAPDAVMRAVAELGAVRPPRTA